MTLPAAGIDVAGNTLNIRPGGSDFTATGKGDGFGKVAGIPREGGATRAVMEAAGRMRRGVLRFPRERGFDVLVVNLGQSRDVAGAGGAPAKTDRVDAGTPAAFGTMLATAPADATIDRLRDMPVPRERLADRRAALHAVPSETGRTGSSGEPVARVPESVGVGIAEHDGPVFTLTSVPGSMRKHSRSRCRCRGPVPPRRRVRSRGWASWGRSTTARPRQAGP